MKAEYIEPFENTLISVFDTMLGCKVTKADPNKPVDPDKKHEISGIIGMSGKARGAVALSMSREAALAAAGALLCEKMTDMNSDVTDAVGEITNIVVGSAKAKLAHLDLSISIPTVILGIDHKIDFPRNIMPVVVPFDSSWGYIAIQVGLMDQADLPNSKFKCATSI
jgi:chemotaxis protein CheX